MSSVGASGAERAAYIAFEGVDAAGKSTQAKRLAKKIDAVLTFEPGGTDLGKLIRPLLLNGAGTTADTTAGTTASTTPADAVPSSTAEALLFAADRAQNLAKVVAPALVAGRHVVSDRSYGSTLAYQGYGRQLHIDRIWELVLWTSRLANSDLTSDLAEAAQTQNRFARPAALTAAPASETPAKGEVFLLPDVVVLLHAAMDEVAERSSDELDRFESESGEFLRRVAQGYQTLAEQDDSRWVKVDASGTPDEVEQKVWKALAANRVFEMITATES